ncbi:transposase [Deferribacter autotrophicus]|uniref:Transposase n=2 Tax=Deferribacter autotrophicus TaxID=500465 RepID=A0A5A8F3C2_9BACT|nr:IS21-like element helper ATPase IstB [Deferribacter autotrophicus]KAA0256808.1 transposase [Deferribacter autotrophicus]KAA0257451.1 transposase [Deferribacter autotrophicus]KAA0257479.1 transposase [Deferribacter autotrophicus]KAA0258258.1 transposase [Deferribacter autotrophicus]KAA0259258.1 transposase [Deferribacter autotrophicus]
MELDNLLSQLSLKGFSAALTKQQENPVYNEMPFEERLIQLLQAELSERLNRKIKRNLAAAKLKEKMARVEDIDYGIQRGLNKSIMTSLIGGDYLRRKQNIIITGPTGTGKSYIAQALANRAILDGYTARYYRVPRLMEELKLARLEGDYIKMLSRLARFNLLILDDFGISAFEADEANDLLEVIEDRVGVNSTIVTSQLPIDNWYDCLKNATVADAILDRLVHSSHKIKLSGESVRKLKSEENIV